MLATLVGAARRDAGRARRDHQVLWLAAFAVSVGLATAVAAPAWAAPGFDNERPAGYDVTPILSAFGREAGRSKPLDPVAAQIRAPL